MKDWLATLITAVSKKKIVILKIPNDDWESINSASNGFGSFSFARPHKEFEDVRDKTICLFLPSQKAEPIHLGLVTSRSAVTTVQSRVRIVRAFQIHPKNTAGLTALLPKARREELFVDKMKSKSTATVLSDAVGKNLISALAKEDANLKGLRAIANLVGPRTFSNAVALQTDAIEMALKVFGHRGKISPKIIVRSESDSELIGARLLEDAVVEHDARRIPGMTSIHADITGYAEFEDSGRRIRIYTANKRPLEKLFGVDLIYLNLKHRNMVLVQYKMLEANTARTDWIYRPDAQLDAEVQRMDQFRQSRAAQVSAYRINPEAFYMKFVKRDAPTGSHPILMPIDHFKLLQANSSGTGGAVKISYNDLGGHYLREDGLVDLIKSGYIGAYSEESDAFETLIKAVLEGGNAIVTAIEDELPGSSS